jgi:hypothetical protein
MMCGMETKEPTGPDFQRQLRHLDEQVDQKRHDLDALRQLANDNEARAHASDIRADEHVARSDQTGVGSGRWRHAPPLTGNASTPSAKTV